MACIDAKPSGPRLAEQDFAGLFWRFEGELRESLLLE
jgi:hypothetical protein